jgi:two-component system response regulator HydG
MTRRGRLLVVEDDAEMRCLLEEELREAGYEVLTASSGDAALECLALAHPDVVVTDLVMPGMKGDELLARIRSGQSEVPVVIITAFGSVESAVAAVKAGAYHYVVKPFPMEQLLVTVENALRERRLRGEIQGLREALGGGTGHVVGESPAMRGVLDILMRAASADAPVLLLGESGTGKEILARLVHTQSPRSQAAFVAVNCSAIPDTLLESQLFGHRRGSFTDAREDRRGLFQEADHGTVFLDEIGDMPAALQAKILRVLQEKEIHPLGAPAPLPVDARVVAATHRDLESLVEEGRFRQDLYYRLNVIAVRIPPLRERPEDILPLAVHFLEKHGRRMGRSSCSLSPEAVDGMRAYAWPGNVRELENAIERALVLGRDDVIWLHDLPDTIRHPRLTAVPAAARPMAAIEREHILRTLGAVSGNKTAAARLLGMDRKTLYRKLEAYGIRLP